MINPDGMQRHRRNPEQVLSGGTIWRPSWPDLDALQPRNAVPETAEVADACQLTWLRRHIWSRLMPEAVAALSGLDLRDADHSARSPD